MSNFRNRSVDIHQFSMVPNAEIPRSSFRMQKMLKTSFDSGLLVPMYVEEVLPGDTFNVSMTAFARLATPIFPFMDNLHFETFFFFVPNRLVWDNWQRFMGEQPNPGDSTDFLIPVAEFGEGLPRSAIGQLADYMGIPVGPQMTSSVHYSVNALPFRGYNLIYNEWFRDQNLQNRRNVPTGDGPDDPELVTYELLHRGKRHDYFTSCLPFVQKGIASPLIVSGTAPVTPVSAPPSVDNIPLFRTASVATAISMVPASAAIAANIQTSAASSAESLQWTTTTGLEVDLADATSNTINQLRQAFQIQKLLERDARGGTRYTEMVRAHFGVISPDARMQRPEYLGGGSTPISINPVAQTAPTDATSPQGNLAGFGTMLGRGGHGFTYSATEHGYILGLMNVRADLTYQQGIRRHWSRQTRYDYYFPVFAMLGEQAVLRKEIFATGVGVDDDIVFGYQERWAEYRYHPSEVTGLMRSYATGTIDVWHLAQNFASAPVLDAPFIRDHATPAGVERVVAVGDEANGQQFIMDAFFDIKCARPLPMYSVPGLVDHF